MLTVHIAGESRSFPDLDDIDESWLRQQIGSRRDLRGGVCVQVAIHTDDHWMRLSSAQCPDAPAGRAPTPAERRILELWNHHHLDEPNFPVGQLIAFLKQLRRIT